MLGLAATSSHTAHIPGITAAAAAHPTNTSFEFKSTRPRNTWYSLAAAVQQQQQLDNSSEPLLIHRRNAYILCYLFPTCDTPGISRQPHAEGGPW